MTDKELILRFVKHVIPDDVECGNISLVPNEDGSVSIIIGNKEEND